MKGLFKNETVIISGGLGDIGRATALEFAKQGANVALCDLHPASGATGFLKELTQYKIESYYSEVDVTHADAVQNWVMNAERKLGVCRIVVANAATATFSGVIDITPEQWSRELRVNLDGAFYLTQSVATRLLYHGLPGRVVFIGSWAAHTVHPHIPAYSVSKAGLRMLCKCMALELASHQILVNEIAPGFVDAGLTAANFKENPGTREKAEQKIPTHQLISAKDVAQQVVALCHPQNRHITGTTILMDGGLSLLT